jgi:putative transposase
MIINYAYKYRLYPTVEQKVLLAKHFGCNRFVWNYFLKQRQDYYLNNKEEIEEKRIKGSLNYYDNARDLTTLKNTEEYSWLKECNSQSLQSTLKHLDTAYKMFFRKVAKFPNFKSKDFKQSFTVPQFLTLEKREETISNGTTSTKKTSDDKTSTDETPNKKATNKIYFPKFKEGIKVKEHRELKGKFVVSTISKNCANEYYVSIIVEKEIEQMQKLTKAVGIDVGIKDFCVCSDGVVFENKKYLSKKEKKLKHLQRQLSKKKKRSLKNDDIENNIEQGKNREKAKLKVAKLHQRIANARADYLHKISNKLTNENQIICLEDLNIKGMQQNHKLAKAVGDCSWSEFNRMLEYKMKWKGREIIKIDRYFPSSQVCSSCGFKNNEIKDLKIREWTCPNCNTHHNRDKNASINILRQGLNLIHNGGRNCHQKHSELPSLEGTVTYEAQSSLAIG